MRQLSLRSRFALVAVSVLALSGGVATVPVSADDGPLVNQFRAHLDPLNNSGAQGHAHARMVNGRIRLEYRATGLMADAPHAAHIHFGRKARHECPSVRDDDNRDFRLNTTEGIPAYGPINISTTTRGDFSPDSALALNRMPLANDNGTIHYERGGLKATNARARRGIKRGNGVLVIHGVDYNHNGRYDMNGAGESELADGVPAEATDPALCGRLRRNW